MSDSSDDYRSSVRGLRDVSFGATIKVYRAGPDGKPLELLRMETPSGKLLKGKRRIAK